MPLEPGLKSVVDDALLGVGNGPFEPLPEGRFAEEFFGRGRELGGDVPKCERLPC